MPKKKVLSPKQRDELITTLKARFEKNKTRHKGIAWSDVEARLNKNADKLWSLSEMERTGGEPDVVTLYKKSGAYTFVDCSKQSPAGRRSTCFDPAARASRKEAKPKDSAVGMAADMGIELLTEDQYRALQELGEFDTTTSSWVVTPPEIRKLGGALFCDRRYDTVFTYHNGAESYYAARGFRGSLQGLTPVAGRGILSHMKVSLPYGEGAIEATVPDDATLLLPTPTAPVTDPDAAVLAAILDPIDLPPLAKLVRAGQTACIVVSDVTRPVPNAIILPPILDILERNGIARDDITILVGTGLHRASRDDERRRFLGEAIMSNYRIVDHDAKDDAQLAPFAPSNIQLPTSNIAPDSGTDSRYHTRLNRAYLDADLKILTGFVEPHLFAGYSGGGKAVLPAIAGAADIMANHDARMVGHPKATWCTTHGNPIFEAMRDTALKTQPSFLLNVTLDEKKRITGVFAGEMAAAHDAAIAQAAKQALQPIPHLYDIVVVTNMGYPADLNLYQSVKAMSVAAQACAPAGAILLVAECREGLGGDEYVALMKSAESPQALVDRFESSDHRTLHDQWQVQVQAMVQARCDVWLHSSMTREVTESAHLRWSEDVDATISALSGAVEMEHNRQATICVMPFGQLTVPQLQS